MISKEPKEKRKETMVREKIEKIYKEESDFNFTKIADKLGVSRQYVSRIINSLRRADGLPNVITHMGGRPGSMTKNKPDVNIIHKDSDKTSIDYRENSGTVEVNGEKVKTGEQACEYAGVDMDIWEIERQVVNFWDVTMKIDDVPTARTNYQVKVWLKRKVKNNTEMALERLVERIPDFKYSKYTPTHFASRSGYAGEVAPMDAHLGKLAWALETQQRDYDLKIGVRDYEYANDQTLEWISPFSPEKIFYVLGQDLMHTENLEGVTHRGGNVLDVDSRLDKLMDAAIDITIKNINSCRSMAPVEVILIPGNHDMHASKWLARCLDRHYRKDKHVEVDYGPNNRKARLWGRTLVGWCHEIPPSKAAAYANELAQIFRKEWAEAEYVEWHHGHKHKKSEVKSSPVITHGGVLMRQLTALSPIDFWHYENLFTDAVPGGEAFVWHKEIGVVANFVAWTKHMKKL